MRKPRAVLYVTIATLVGLALAACGDGEGERPSDGSVTPAVEETAQPPESETATPEVKVTTVPTPSPTPVASEVGMTLEEFRIVPSTLSVPLGTVTFQVRNGGTLTHQFVVIRTDLSQAALPRAEDGGVDESKVDVVDKIEAIDPGEEATLTLELEPAKYVLVCNIVADGTSHYLKGMYNRFTVNVR